jgi:hypothetical protein
MILKKLNTQGLYLQKKKYWGKKEINLILNNIEESIENNDIENLKRILNHPSIELSLDHEINDLVWNDN